MVRGAGGTGSYIPPLSRRADFVRVLITSVFPGPPKSDHDSKFPNYR